MAGIFGPVIVNYLREFQLSQGVAKAQAYDTTMLILAALLVAGFLCNLLIRPVAPKWQMSEEELAAARKLAHEVAPAGNASTGVVASSSPAALSPSLGLRSASRSPGAWHKPSPRPRSCSSNHRKTEPMSTSTFERKPPIKLAELSSLSPAEIATIHDVLARLKDLPGALLPILHGIQDALGFVPKDAVAIVAKSLNLSRAEVHGVVSFYHWYRTESPARTSSICVAPRPVRRSVAGRWKAMSRHASASTSTAPPPMAATRWNRPIASATAPSGRRC